MAHNAKNAARSRPVTIRAARADFDQCAMHLSFTGGATAEQERDVMSGETLSATLNSRSASEENGSARQLLPALDERGAARPKSTPPTWTSSSTRTSSCKRPRLARRARAQPRRGLADGVDGRSLARSRFRGAERAQPAEGDARGRALCRSRSPRRSLARATRAPPTND